MNPKVDFYFTKSGKWKEEFEALRGICLSSGLAEELKWGHPCYTLNGKNIVLMHGFKEYCALLFFKGALMKDPKKILIQQTENVQVPRQVRFTELKQIVKLEATLKNYIKEAIRVEESGVKVELKKTSDFKIVEEFKSKLDKTSSLKKAFYALTPGRQKAYLYYFLQAKQAQTRESRVQKCIPKILEGKGLDD